VGKIKEAISWDNIHLRVHKSLAVGIKGGGSVSKSNLVPNADVGFRRTAGHGSLPVKRDIVPADAFASQFQKSPQGKARSGGKNGDFR